MPRARPSTVYLPCSLLGCLAGQCPFYLGEKLYRVLGNFGSALFEARSEVLIGSLCRSKRRSLSIVYGVD